MALVSPPIRERAVAIEPHGLIGVVTQPASNRPDLPVIVILNGGILHRSGQGRIYVTLSRKLSALGYQVLRFDLSGIGDTPPRGEGLPPIEAALKDIWEAVDWVEKDGAGVVLMGLCDGATLAAYHASVDPRVVGAMLIDPLIPRTWRYRLLHTWRRLLRPRTWIDPSSGEIRLLGVLKQRLRVAAIEGAPPPFDPNAPHIRQGLEDTYRRLLATGSEIYALFTAGMQHRHCYREQMLEAFPGLHFHDRFRIDYFDANDHHFEWPPHREFFMETAINWLQSADFRTRPAGEVDDGSSASPNSASPNSASPSSASPSSASHRASFGGHHRS